jgi:hypothetical protein
MRDRPVTAFTLVMAIATLSHRDRFEPARVASRAA